MVNLSQDSIDEFRVRTALESALIQLDASWLILGDLRLDGPNQAAAADYAVLNPQYGVALIDVVHRRTGEPEQRLRRFLNERGFAGRFPGALPIVRLVLTQCDAASLERQLRAAFGQATPIGIADPDWVAAINAVLAPATAATTRPGFPLFRRPTPRRRDAPERDATQQADESWNVAPEAPPKPEAQPKPETQPTTASRAARAKSAPETSSPAPQPPAPERAADGAAVPSADEEGGGWRAKPRRQAPLSDEPTAGQQIQSLIALLRQNGVQRRMPSRLEEDDRAMLGGGAASAGQGPAAQPAAPPAQRATEADLFGAAPPDHFLTPPQPQPYRRGPAKPAARPEEAEDDVLSSAKTSHSPARPATDPAASGPAVDTEFDVPPPVEAPPEPGAAPVAAEEAAAPQATPRKSRWRKFIAPAFTTLRAEPPVESVESEAESREYPNYAHEVPPSVAAMSASPEEPATVSITEPDDRDGEPTPIAAQADPELDDAAALSDPSPSVVEPVEAKADEIEPAMTPSIPVAPPSDVSPARPVSSSIIVPGRDDAEMANEAEAETTEEIEPASYGDLRVTRADQLAAPHVASSIVAPAGFRGLSVRPEDAIAPRAPQPTRWRSGLAAGVLLIAALGGGAAWFRLAAVSDWLMPTSTPVSVVSSLPAPSPTQPSATPPAVTPPSSTALSSAAQPPTADDNKTAAVAPPSPPTPATKPSAPPAAPVATPTPAAPPRSSTMTAAITPPQIETPPAPAKRVEPVKRPAPRRAAPPRALAVNPPSAERDTTGRETAAAQPRATRDSTVAAASGNAATAALPPIPQGPPIDATDLPPIATPAAAPVAGVASADATESRLHAPTNLTPVWTRASTSAPAATPAAATAPSAGAGGEACHSYTATRTLLGQPRQVSGLACRDGSGQWQIISELPR